MQEDPAELFKRLNDELYSHIDQQYFQEPRDFKSLVEVLNVLESRVDQIIYQNKIAGGGTGDGGGYEAGNSLTDLQKQLEVVKRVIEDVVTFQQGGMNNSLDTMREVVKEYCRGREDIQRLRKSLAETQTVLTAKKTGQISLRDLWLKKAELQESLRLVRDIEELKNVPHKVFRLMQQRRYYAAVLTLNAAVEKMFGEDLVGVAGLVQIRESIMDLKENLLDACVQELKEQIIGPTPDFQAPMEIQDTSETASVNDFEAQSDVGGGGNHNSSAFLGIAGNNGSIQGSESSRRQSQRASFSEYAPSRHAGSVSGDSPSAPNNAAIFGSNNALWPQYRDLKDVDEHVEASLTDPSTAGPVYMRLLVKTVGALKCEEDVERLIFETIFSRFQSFVVQVREIVFKRRQDQWLNDETMQNNGEYDESLWMVRDGKAFTQFVGSLLESTSGIVARLMYVWTLLTINRSVRTGIIDAASVSSVTVHDIARAERDKARQLLFTTWHDIEDKVWLEIFRHLADPEILKISDTTVSINGSVKRPNTQMYESSDLTMLAGNQNNLTSPATNNDDGEESKFASDKLLLFHPSSSHAAAVYNRVMAYQSTIQRIFKEYGLDIVFSGGGNSDAHGSNINTPLSNGIPSKATMNPFAMKAASSSSAPQTILQMTKNQDAQRKLQEEMLSRITEPLQAFLESELIPIIQSSVNEDMRAMQLQPAEYFQPISATTKASDPTAPVTMANAGGQQAGNRHSTGATANANSTATSTSTSTGGNGPKPGTAASTPGAPSTSTSTSTSAVVSRHTTIHIAPCRAAERGLFHAEALIRYWQQLSQHRTMLSVVLDRLLRGFVASAKDHVETLTWNWQSQALLQQEKAAYKQLLVMLEDDVVYAQYYTQRVLQGKMTLEELLLPIAYVNHSSASLSSSSSVVSVGGIAAKSALLALSDSSINSNSSSSSSPSFARASQRPLAQYYAQELMTLHAQTAVWDLAGSGAGGGYVLGDSAKALAPLAQGGAAITGVACVAAACDWLLYRLVGAYNATMKKLMLAHHHYQQQGHGHHHHNHHSHHSHSHARQSTSTLAISSSLNTAISNSSSSSSSGVPMRRASGSGLGIASGGEIVGLSALIAAHNSAMEQMQQMKDCTCLALQEVQRLSKAALLFLRHTVQVLCFHYVQKLIHVNFLLATSSSSSSTTGNAGGSETAAEDSILTALMQQLYAFVEAFNAGYVLSFSGSSLLPSVIGPIVSLIPRLLMRCVTVIMQLAPSLTAPSSSTAGLNNSSSSGGVSGATRPSGYVLNKTRLLRLVVSTQQLVVAFFNQKLGISDGESKRRLLEVLSEESERVRKIASLIEAPANEIRQYFKKVFAQRELDKETARALWLRATERAGEGTFEEVWRDLELSQQQQQYSGR